MTLTFVFSHLKYDIKEEILGHSPTKSENAMFSINKITRLLACHVLIAELVCQMFSLSL